MSLALAVTIGAIVVVSRRSSPPRDIPATAALAPPTVTSLELAPPAPKPAFDQTPTAIELLPEAPVDALPKAPLTMKPVGAERRVAPAVAPSARPLAHPSVDTAAGARGAPLSADTPAPPTTAATKGAPEADGDESPAAAVVAPSVPPPMDPLVKAVRDDIDEDEARHK